MMHIKLQLENGIPGQNWGWRWRPCTSEEWCGAPAVGWLLSQSLSVRSAAPASPAHLSCTPLVYCCFRMYLQAPLSLGGVNCNLVGYSCQHSMHLSKFLEGVTKARQLLLISQEWFLSIKIVLLWHTFTGWVDNNKSIYLSNSLLRAKAMDVQQNTPMVYSVQELLLQRLQTRNLLLPGFALIPLDEPHFLSMKCHHCLSTSRCFNNAPISLVQSRHNTNRFF